MLSALAQHTKQVRLSALVTGNTYRNPALLAKTITTLDHVSHGRATLGIGAGWFEKEHLDLGFDYGSFTDRFEKLEEAWRSIESLAAMELNSLAGFRLSLYKARQWESPVFEPFMLARVKQETIDSMWNAVARGLDMSEVLELNDGCTRDSFMENYAVAIAEAIAQGQLSRSSVWTESIAVGEESFVSRIAQQTDKREELKMGMIAEGVWMLREAGAPYG